MKCPVCVKEGLTSQVYPQGLGMVTLLGWPRFYDKDGAYHSHDPNYNTTNYVCSQSHKWLERTRTLCPSCSYGREDPIVSIITELDPKPEPVVYVNPPTSVNLSGSTDTKYICPICHDNTVEFQYQVDINVDLGNSVSCIKLTCPNGHIIYVEDWE